MSSSIETTLCDERGTGAKLHLSAAPGGSLLVYVTTVNENDPPDVQVNAATFSAFAEAFEKGAWLNDSATEERDGAA